MSVHTLQEKNDMVQIGANVTKGEAPEAGLQILRFCYRVADKPAPLVLEDPDVYRVGAANVGNRRVAYDPDQDRVELSIRDVVPVFRFTPAEAVEIGAWLVSIGRYALDRPDPEQVERLAAFIAEADAKETPKALAETILRSFDLTERAL